jgi:hydrogenase expression/formation protein HypC
MCLAIPAKVVEIINTDTILVDFGGVKREVKSTLLEDKIKLDDYVLVHIGFAMAIVEEEEALETLRLLAEIDAFNQNVEGFSEEQSDS